MADPDTMDTVFSQENYQRKAIEEKLREPLALDQVWYLIDMQWFHNFKSFVGFHGSPKKGISTNPGPIDNTPILDNSKTKLKTNLHEDLDYVIIPPGAWNLLVQWYGLEKDQTPIGRRVVNSARPPGEELKVEVYKVILRLYSVKSLDSCVIQEFSSSTLVSDVETFCRQIFKVPSTTKTRLKCWYNAHRYQILSSDSLIAELSLDKNLNIVMEFADETQNDYQIGNLLGREKATAAILVPVRPAAELASTHANESFSKPKPILMPKPKESSKIPRVRGSASCPSLVKPSSSCGSLVYGVIKRQNEGASTSQKSDIKPQFSFLNSAEGQGPSCTPGLSGLLNLGNTCFLNSIVQCLSNCEAISTYFQERRHAVEINVANPFGKAGAIANSFADLIAMLWSGRHNLTVPRHFKLQLTKFAPQFVGHQQHDSQEFLTFLLDGLHEDLNRVTGRPSPPIEESGTDQDDELARITWENFQRRNDSVIVDNFHGMLKSRVVCPNCEKVSIKFDTFSTLSLPLPTKSERTFTVRLIPYNPNVEEMTVKVEIPESGTFQDLLSELGRMTKISPKRFIATHVQKHHFHRFYSFEDSLDLIGHNRNEIFVYEMPLELHNNCYGILTVLPVVLWEIEDTESNSSSFDNNLIGTPFLVILPVGRMSIRNLYGIMCDHMVRNFKHFKNANTLTIHDFSTMNIKCEGLIDSNENSASHMLFTPVMVCSKTSTVKLIGEGCDNEERHFEIPERFCDNFMALQIPKSFRLAHYTERTPVKFTFTKNPPEDIATLEECLNLFIKSEKLGENNAWKCPYCDTFQKATKKLDLWKLPNILVFHLKRFSFEQSEREKLTTKVLYPMCGLSIDHLVVNKEKDNLVYDLIGVNNHYGGLTGGHYTSFCKNYREGNWYCYDDSKVSSIPPEHAKSDHAYMLIYQRRSKGEMSSDGERLKQGTSDECSKPKETPMEEDAPSSGGTTTKQILEI